MHHGLAWYVFTLSFAQKTVPFHSPNARQMSAVVRAVHEDRERVFLPGTFAKMMDGQTWIITRDLELRHPTLKWCKSMVLFLYIKLSAFCHNRHLLFYEHQAMVYTNNTCLWKWAITTTRNDMEINRAISFSVLCLGWWSIVTCTPWPRCDTG